MRAFPICLMRATRTIKDRFAIVVILRAGLLERGAAQQEIMR